MQMYCKKIFLALTAIILITACGENNPHQIDVSDVNVKVDLNRYEKEFFNIEEENFTEEFTELRKKYPLKTELMVEQILGFGRLDDKTGEFMIPLKERFYGDSYVRELNEDIQEKYSPEKIEEMEDELTQAFKHLRHYYPDATIPELYTTLTSFTYSIVTYEDIMGISLDMYMGQDYKFYPSMDFPDYKTRRMNEHYITPDVLTSWYLDQYPESEYTSNSLLSYMIYEGKALYFLDVMMPEAHDSIKIQYTAEDLRWSQAHESRIWDYFVEEDMLFETENHIHDRYIQDGPFTSSPGFPRESAPRLGIWTGWQVVRSYMENNEEVTFRELMEEQDYEKILRGSGYRP